MPIEMLGSSAKRPRLEERKEEEEEEEEGPSRYARVSCANADNGLTIPHSETRTGQAVTAQHTSSSSKPTSTSVPTTPPRKPDVGTSLSQRPNTSTNVDPTNKPTLDLTTEDDVTEIPSSPAKQVPPTANKSESPRPAKRLKKRSRVPSEVFASQPSSPTKDPAVAPSSQALPAPPNTLTEGARVSTSAYPRAPPRFVDSFHGQVLVDRMGHVPRAFPQDRAEDEEKEKEKEDAEEAGDKVQWPPPRGHAAKPGKASGPHAEVDPHHPFSQLQPQPRPPEKVPRQLDVPDRHAVVAQFLGEVRRGEESERHKDVVQNSPVKRIVSPAPEQFSDLVPGPSSKATKFPAPRPSTMSPFRLESPAGETRYAAPVPQPQLRPQSWTKPARHPELTRIRRQSERECKPEHAKVPSIDLVALSRSSMSTSSHSRSSTDTSAFTRRPRWSLPALMHTAPWVLNEPRGGPSGSPLRWAPSAVYEHDNRAGTSSPRFMFTPSPAGSVTAVTTDVTGPLSHVSDPAPAFPAAALSLAPHQPDLSLTASHGLASILAHMSVNHGLALGVVEAVYKRVGSLKEADEVLRGMKEAAEGFGEREIKRRLRERKRRWVRCEGKAALRYVMASEDGEGSEYSPPETSRAAMWKRQSEAVGHTEEGGEEDDEDNKGPFVAHHGFSQHVPALDGEEEKNDGEQDALGPKEAAKEERTMEEALVEHLPAQELERRMGRGQFRKDIVKRFV